MTRTNTKVWHSLLLYLEARAVDYGGRVKPEQINEEERAIIDDWVEEGFIEFGRIVFADHNRDGSNWVRLSPKAWVEARRLRRQRADRMWENRRYERTCDKD